MHPADATQPDRAQGGAYPEDVENRRTPSQPGQPPRPATEPPGSEGSSDTDKTLTDPATGEPHPKPKP